MIFALFILTALALSNAGKDVHAAVATGTAAEATTQAGGVPSLDDLAADWMEVKTLRNFPSVNNFWVRLAGPNLTSFDLLTFPPYANHGEDGVLKIDGKPVEAAESRWYPYQVSRRAHAMEFKWSR